MSTILIDRRTAVLLGELAATSAADRPVPASVDGVALGVRLRGRVVEEPRRVSRRTPAGAAGATRPVPRPVSEKSSRAPALTVRRRSTAEARLRTRLRCAPAAPGRGSRGAAAPAPRRVGTRRPASGPLHLTRRGRLVAVLLLLGVLTVAFSVGRVTSTALGGASAPGSEVVVGQGDTLWSIAERIAPDADPRTTAADLMAVNGLGSPSLQVGQHLRLP